MTLTWKFRTQAPAAKYVNWVRERGAIIISMGVRKHWWHEDYVITVQWLDWGVGE